MSQEREDRIKELIQAIGLDIKTLYAKNSNSGQIKLNWSETERPNITGFDSGVVKELDLNSNYTVSSSPTTTYPLSSDLLLNGGNLINTTSLCIKEMLVGQVSIHRLKVGYSGKSASQTGAILLNIYNPNPASSFNEFLPIPAVSGETDFEQTISIATIADSLSLNELYGYKLRVKTSFKDNNLNFYLTNLTSIYLGKEI